MNEKNKNMSSKVDHVLKVNLYQKRLNTSDGIVLMYDKLNSLPGDFIMTFQKRYLMFLLNKSLKA